MLMRDSRMYMLDVQTGFDARICDSLLTLGSMLCKCSVMKVGLSKRVYHHGGDGAGLHSTGVSYLRLKRETCDQRNV